MRAKMRLATRGEVTTQVKQADGTFKDQRGLEVVFYPLGSEDDDPEGPMFNGATPSGRLQMIVVNKEAIAELEKLEIGKAIYVDLSWS